MRASLLCLIMVAASFACGGDDLVLPRDTAAARIAPAAGDGQSGAVGTALPESISVLVSDATGRPAMGHRVAFAVVSGDGARVAPDTATTGADGRAGAKWILGREPGTQRARAELMGRAGDGLEPVVFSASASAGSASVLASVSGNGQSAPAGSPLPDSLVVRAEDQFGNPVGGVRVLWGVSGGGSVSSSQVITSSSGRAAVRRVLGIQPGEQRATASVSGLSGSPVVFSHTATSVGGGPGGPGGGEPDDRVVRLSFLVQPSDGKKGKPLSPPVRVAAVNGRGVPVASAEGQVEIGLGRNPSNADLKGQRTHRFQNGVATFDDLKVTKDGGPYTLIARAEGLSDVESAPFRIAE